MPRDKKRFSLHSTPNANITFAPIDHTITAPPRVELVDCESGRVVLDLPSDLQARIVAAARDAGMGVAEWMELVLSERGRA